jgi:hypothetical protein
VAVAAVVQQEAGEEAELGRWEVELVAVTSVSVVNTPQSY